MPFKSEAQRRWMYAAESRGEVPKGTAERWERHTKGKQLPERVDSEAKKESVDLSVLQSLLEAGQHYGPMAAQHVSDFASSHPLAFGAGTGAAGYAGGRVHQALRDFGKNIARGGRAVGSGIHGAGRAVGQGLKDVSTNAALGVASAGHNVGQGMSAAGRSIGQGVSSAGKSINEANRRREISRTIGRFLKRGSLNGLVDDTEVIDMDTSKISWSLTDSGHKLDAAHYNADSEAAHRKVKAHGAYAGEQPGLVGAASAADVASLLTGLPMVLGGKASLVDRVLNRITERHMDYAAKKHEKGENAYNPFGGWLTESRHEEAEKKAYEYGSATARAAFGLL